MIVRVKPDTFDRLRAMAREAGQSMPEFVDTVIRDYERRQFLEGANADYARLHLRSNEGAVAPAPAAEEVDEFAVAGTSRAQSTEAADYGQSGSRFL